MIVVSNTSLLIGLASIGQLDLLKQPYKEIHIPEAVWHEVVVDGAGQPGADEVNKADWIRRHSVSNRQLVLALEQDLDDGEAEAIALAVELKAGLLITDERFGRNTAKHFGLDFTGVLGVLIEAKRKGLVNEVKRYLDELRIVAGFRISDRLYKKVLMDEGERIV
jgi:predicted nucleic acid-binding protein